MAKPCPKENEMAKPKRTTIMLDEARRSKIREYQAFYDKTIREIIDMALDAFFALEESRDRVKFSKSPKVKSKYADIISSELENYVAPATAKVLLEETCHAYNISVDRISPTMITPGLVADLCRSIAPVAKNGDVRKLEKRLSSLQKGGT